MAKNIIISLKEYIKSIFTSKYQLKQQLIDLESRVFNLEKSNLLVVKNLLSLVNSIDGDTQKFIKKTTKRNTLSNKDISQAKTLNSVNDGDKEPTYH